MTTSVSNSEEARVAAEEEQLLSLADSISKAVALVEARYVRRANPVGGQLGLPSNSAVPGRRPTYLRPPDASSAPPASVLNRLRGNANDFQQPPAGSDHPGATRRRREDAFDAWARNERTAGIGVPLPVERSTTSRQTESRGLSSATAPLPRVEIVPMIRIELDRYAPFLSVQDLLMELERAAFPRRRARGTSGVPGYLDPISLSFQWRLRFVISAEVPEKDAVRFIEEVCRKEAIVTMVRGAIVILQRRLSMILRYPDSSPLPEGGGSIKA